MQSSLKEHTSPAIFEMQYLAQFGGLLCGYIFLTYILTALEINTEYYITQTYREYKYIANTCIT